MYTLTGQEKMKDSPIGTHESWGSLSSDRYTDIFVKVAFETRGQKILVLEQEKFVLPTEVCLRNRRLLAVPDSVIDKVLGLSPCQIRDAQNRFPVRLLGAVEANKQLTVFLKVPITQINKPGWHYINDKDLPDREGQVEPAFLVLADKLWSYAPATV